MAKPKPIAASGKVYKSIFDKNNGIFGAGFGNLMDSLEQFTTALGQTEAETSAIDIATGTIDDFESTMGILNDLLGISMEGARTGFRQSIDDVIPQAQNLYEDFLGQAGNEYANSNIFGGSDWQRDVIGGARRLGEDLGARQFDENVRAAQARGDWTAAAQNLDVLTKSFPLAYSADLYNLGERSRKSQEEIRGRPFAIFQSLSGLENQQPFFAPGYNNVSSSAANLNALSQALSSFSGNFNNSGNSSSGSGGLGDYTSIGGSPTGNI